MNFDVKLTVAEDGWIVAEVLDMPGCVSQGRDEDEAIANIAEAAEAWLDIEAQKPTALSFRTE